MAERTKVAAGEWASNLNPELVQLELDFERHQTWELRRRKWRPRSEHVCRDSFEGTF